MVDPARMSTADPGSKLNALVPGAKEQGRSGSEVERVGPGGKSADKRPEPLRRGVERLPVAVVAICRFDLCVRAGLSLRDVHSFRESESAGPSLGLRWTGGHD